MKLHPAISSILCFLAVMSLGLFIVAGSVFWSGIKNRPGDFAAQLKVMPPADAEQTLKERLENYSKQADDLQKLASILLGLAALYTIALGLSSYAAVQMNLQQAGTWMDGQKTLIGQHLSGAQQSINNHMELLNQLRIRADGSVKTLEEVLKTEQERTEKSHTEWKKLLDEIEDTKVYMIRLAAGGAILALATQGKYLSDAPEAIERLKEVRKKKPTDRLVNFYLGRLHKALGQFDKAADAMSAFIQKKEGAGEADDPETADAYYNRACYQSLQYPSANAALKVKLQAGIKADLEKSIYANANNRTDAGDDSDFVPVKPEPWFQQLLSIKES